MRQYTKWEEDGRFGLSVTSESYSQDSGDIGSGSYNSITVFGSAEGREYYIQAETARERETALRRELTALKSELAHVLTPTGKVRRKRLLALMARVVPCP